MDLKVMRKREEQLLFLIKNNKDAVEGIRKCINEFEEELLEIRQKIAEEIVDTYEEAKLLNQKEIVLNQDDTKNFMKAINITKDFLTNLEKDEDYTQKKNEWKKVAFNFNSRKERISTIPNNPHISKVIMSLNNDSSMNITLNWNNTDETIDGFNIYLHSNKYKDNYIFGTDKDNETILTVPLNISEYTIPCIPNNLNYTIGVQAYRLVDEDINENEILQSDIVYFNNKIN